MTLWDVTKTVRNSTILSETREAFVQRWNIDGKQTRKIDNTHYFLFFFLLFALFFFLWLGFGGAGFLDGSGLLASFPLCSRYN